MIKPKENGRILTLPPGRSADFPVRSNVKRQEGFRRLLEPWEGRGLLRTGKSALRWRWQDATVSPGSAGLRPGLLVRHLRSRRIGDRRSGGGDKTRPRSQASVIRSVHAASAWA